MKKLVSFLLILVMLATPVFAVSDYSSMTDEELNLELNMIRAEIVKRRSEAAGDTVLADTDGVTVTFKGQPELKENYDGSHSLVLNVTVVNSSDKGVGIRVDDCYVNGWKVSASFFTELEPGAKVKEKITISKVDLDAELEALEDLEDVKLTFLTFDPSTYKTISKGIVARIDF